jgi:hypothetical protein
MINSRGIKFTIFIIVLSLSVFFIQSCEWITKSEHDGSQELISFPEPGSKFEIGSEITILWKSSSFQSDEVTIELYQNDAVILNIHPASPNIGHFIWKIPDDASWGNSFRIRISEIRQDGDQAFSDGHFVLYKYVNFSDEHLRSQIQHTLNLSGSNITTDDLSYLEWFEGTEISDLTGIEFCTNLRVLTLSVSSFSDISPISNLTNLLNLRLSIVNINDLSPIAGLMNLTFLSLKYCGLENISNLRNLSNLVGLELTGNKISDMSFLTNLKLLKYLNIQFNLVSDIEWITTLDNLQKLNLSNNQLNDIRPLETLTKIKELDLSRNTIRNIECLSNLRNILILNLSHNLVRNLTPLLENQGIGLGDTIYLGNTNVNRFSREIVELRNRGVMVIF